MIVKLQTSGAETWFQTLSVQSLLQQQHLDDVILDLNSVIHQVSVKEYWSCYACSVSSAHCGVWTLGTLDWTFATPSSTLLQICCRVWDCFPVARLILGRASSVCQTLCYTEDFLVSFITAGSFSSQTPSTIIIIIIICAWQLESSESSEFQLLYCDVFLTNFALVFLSAKKRLPKVLY